MLCPKGPICQGGFFIVLPVSQVNMGKKLTDLGLVVGWCGVACVSLCFRDPAHCHMPKVENL